MQHDAHTLISNKGRGRGREKEHENERARIAYVIRQSDQFLFTFLIMNMGKKQDCDENGKLSSHVPMYTESHGSCSKWIMNVSKWQTKIIDFRYSSFSLLHLVLIIFNHFWSLLKAHSIHWTDVTVAVKRQNKQNLLSHLLSHPRRWWKKKKWLNRHFLDVKKNKNRMLAKQKSRLKKRKVKKERNEETKERQEKKMHSKSKEEMLMIKNRDYMRNLFQNWRGIFFLMHGKNPLQIAFWSIGRLKTCIPSQT